MFLVYKTFRSLSETKFISERRFRIVLSSFERLTRDLYKYSEQVLSDLKMEEKRVSESALERKYYLDCLLRMLNDV